MEKMSKNKKTKKSGFGLLKGIKFTENDKMRSCIADKD